MPPNAGHGANDVRTLTPRASSSSSWASKMSPKGCSANGRRELAAEAGVIDEGCQRCTALRTGPTAVAAFLTLTAGGKSRRTAPVHTSNLVRPRERLLYWPLL